MQRQVRNQVERRLRDRRAGASGSGRAAVLRRGGAERGWCGLGRRRAQAARPAVAHLFEIDQQVGEAALDGFEMAEPGVGGVELLRQLGDAVLERAERKLIALAELHAVEPLAQRADRAFQLGRHGAAAFHQRRDPRFELGERLGAAVGGGALELGAEPAHLGGELRQRAVRGDVGDDAAQRHHGLLELLERQRIALRAPGRTRRSDRSCATAPRTASSKPTRLSAGVRLRSASRTSASSRSSDRQRRAIGAGLPGAVDPLGQRAHLGFERFDGPARHGLGQRPADLGEIAAQRAERVLVGLMQRRNLRVDLAELLLQAGEVRSGAPVAARRRRRCGGAGPAPAAGAAIERALARGNLCGPVGGTAAGRGRWRGRGRMLVSECGGGGGGAYRARRSELACGARPSLMT